MRGCFDERAGNRYSDAMRAATALLRISSGIATLLFLSCSFDYGNGAEESAPVPGLVMETARAERYEDSRLSVVIEADILEMYDTDRIWSGSGVLFLQYAHDGTGTLEAEGSAALLLVEDAKKRYTLGGGTWFRYYPDGITLTSPDLRWDKASSLLQGPVDGAVLLEKDDGSRVEGLGFSADTLERSYRFGRAVSGAMARAEEATPAEGETE